MLCNSRQILWWPKPSHSVSRIFAGPIHSSTARIDDSCPPSSSKLPINTALRLALAWSHITEEGAGNSMSEAASLNPAGCGSSNSVAPRCASERSSQFCRLLSLTELEKYVSSIHLQLARSCTCSLSLLIIN